MKNKKVKEVNSIEELQMEVAKTQIKKGSNKIRKELLDKIKNSENKDNIFYYKNTIIRYDKRLYDKKPEWAEQMFHLGSTEEIKIHLTGDYDQQTLDLLNHILYLRENE